MIYDPCEYNVSVHHLLHNYNLLQILLLPVQIVIGHLLMDFLHQKIYDNTIDYIHNYELQIREDIGHNH